MQTLEQVLTSYGFKFDYPFTHPIFPIIAVLFYAFIIFYFSPKDSEINKTKIKSKSKGLTPLKLFIIIHNIILCLFSWIVFINVFPEIYDYIFIKNNYNGFICSEMSKNELYWSYLFYLSKIWEFIDTFIILYKGKKPSLLQTYHHIGAVFACWSQVIVAGKTFWVFVCFNSFIHTIMYFYYAITTFGIKFRFKFIITIMQLLQFLIGQTIGYLQYFYFDGKKCMRSNDFWVWVFNQIYVWPLVILFIHFYNKTYNKTKDKTKRH